MDSTTAAVIERAPTAMERKAEYDRQYYLKNREKKMAYNREYMRRRYHSDPTFKRYKIEYARRRYQSDPAYRERVLANKRAYDREHSRELRLNPIFRERERAYQRVHEIGVRVDGHVGKIRHVVKRPYPNGICELCGHKSKRMAYHHFDGEVKPNTFVNGIWLCRLCHNFVERLESGLAMTYAAKKANLMGMLV